MRSSDVSDSAPFFAQGVRCVGVLLRVKLPQQKNCLLVFESCSRARAGAGKQGRGQARGRQARGKARPFTAQCDEERASRARPSSARSTCARAFKQTHKHMQQGLARGAPFAKQGQWQHLPCPMRYSAPRWLSSAVAGACMVQTDPQPPNRSLWHPKKTSLMFSSLSIDAHMMQGSTVT